jgi:hypothetical protein
VEFAGPDTSAGVQVEDVASFVLLERRANVLENIVCVALLSALALGSPTTAPGGNIPHRPGLTICVLAYDCCRVLKSTSAGTYPVVRLVITPAAGVLTSSERGYVDVVRSRSALQKPLAEVAGLLVLAKRTPSKRRERGKARMRLRHCIRINAR